MSSSISIKTAMLTEAALVLGCSTVEIETITRIENFKGRVIYFCSVVVDRKISGEYKILYSLILLIR